MPVEPSGPGRESADEPGDETGHEPGIVEKIAGLHGALDRAGLPHAFGGALALAWCTERARGTVDIDVNVFVDAARASEVLDALPAAVSRSEADAATCARDGQVRLWWGRTPVDIFTDTTDFHRAAAERVVVHRLGSHTLPFLSCADLAVFKAFFDRARDRADLEEMATAGTLDVDHVVATLVRYLGPDDPRTERIDALRGLSP